MRGRRINVRDDADKQEGRLHEAHPFVLREGRNRPGLSLASVVHGSVTPRVIPVSHDVFAQTSRFQVFRKLG